MKKFIIVLFFALMLVGIYTCEQQEVQPSIAYNTEENFEQQALDICQDTVNPLLYTTAQRDYARDSIIRVTIYNNTTNQTEFVVYDTISGWIFLPYQAMQFVAANNGEPVATPLGAFLCEETAITQDSVYFKGRFGTTDTIEDKYVILIQLTYGFKGLYGFNYDNPDD